MKTKLLITCALSVLSIVSVEAQSKEQREALRQWPVTLRVKVGKEDSKQTKSESGTGIFTSQSVTIEKTKRWTADIDIRQTNMPEKVELKVYYIGLKDGDTLAVLGSDTKAVTFNEKGHCSIELTSPTFSMTKQKRKKTISSFQNSSTNREKPKDETGERLEGAAMQLLVNGTIVKTFVSKPIWLKGTWVDNPTADDFNPMVRKK